MVIDLRMAKLCGETNMKENLKLWVRSVASNLIISNEMQSYSLFLYLSLVLPILLLFFPMYLEIIMNVTM